VAIERNILMGRELVSIITNEVMKRAHLASGFNILYSIIEKYILKKCFEVSINDIEDERLRRNLSDLSIQDAIVDLLAKEIGKISIDRKESIAITGNFKLSSIEPFKWRRKHLRCKKTVFNFVAVYNDFEAEFAEFLDNCPDIEKFAALAETFKIDYLSSRGSIRFYYPDWVAVQKIKDRQAFWIIETKGREYEDTDRKDAAIKKWSEDVSQQSKENWKYIKVLQYHFDKAKNRCRTFDDLLSNLNSM
jgi:type III restriction enzyme